MQAYLKEGFQSNLKIDAHVFELSLIEEFIKSIHAYNANHPGSEPITKIRMYYAKSQRGSLKHPDRDLVIVPVTRDGKDLYPVYEAQEMQAKTDAGDPGVIAFSNPCPNQCES